MLNAVEQDLVDFLVEEKGKSRDDAAAQYDLLKRKVRFDSPEFRQSCELAHEVEALMQTGTREQALIRSYREAAPMWLLRYLSYSFSGDHRRTAWQMLRRGHFRKLWRSRKKQDRISLTASHSGVAEFLCRRLGSRTPIVVDYGAGLGYRSFEVALCAQDARIYLLDIESIVLEFLQYRLRKIGFRAEAIKVTESDLYPSLPPHNICFVTEVMEHLARPIEAYNNIVLSMEPGGLLVGNFSDHEPDCIHVSPSLKELRERLADDFVYLSEFRGKNVCYEKKT